MGYKKYANQFKEKVVKEYLSGSRLSDVVTKYDIHKTQVRNWVEKWKEHSSFPDGRGKAKTGRPKVTKIIKKDMTKEQYIAYLEMELDILKYIAFLERKKQK